MEYCESFYKLNKNSVIFNCENKTYLGNTKNGALMSLNSDGQKFAQILENGCSLDSSESTELKKAMLESLFLNGFFEEEETKTINSAYLHITDKCNLQCKGCYSYIDDRNKKQEMTFEEIQLILKKLKEAGLKNLIISGGEPFIREDIINILEYAKCNIGIKNISCITNGIFDTDIYIKASKYLDDLTFSLDSCKKENSLIRGPLVFEKVENTIDILKQHINVSLIFTLHKKNIADIENMREYARLKNVNYNFSLLTVKSSLAEDLKDIYFEDKDYDDLSFVICNYKITDSSLKSQLHCTSCCGAGKTLISISAKGDILPCHMFTENEFIMGNALNDNILQIINNKNNIFNELNVNQFDECSNCEFKYLCGGGCRFRSYAYFNTIKNKDLLCNAYKINLKNLLSFTNN